MNEYNIPDLSGTKVNHKGSDTFSAYAQNQVFEFDGPVFAESIVIKETAQDVTLVLDTDWEYGPTDMTTTSKILVGTPGFVKQLVQSIKILRVVTSPITVNVTFQALQPTIDLVIQGQDLVPITPELFTDTIRRLRKVELETGAIASPLSIATNIADRRMACPIDLKGTSANNYIVDEPYTVDVITNHSLIRPQYGYFYASSVVVKEADTLTILTLGVDYVLKGFSPEKTQLAEVADDVYEHIHITSDTQKNLLITYRAFGGEPSPTSLDLLRSKIVALAAYLESGTQLTEESLVDTPVITSVLYKLDTLEEQMRQLAVGATYLDTGSSGEARIYDLSGADADLHWYTIAKLYTVSGSPTIFKADRFKGRVSFPNIGYMADISVAVDLDNTSKYAVIEGSSIITRDGYTDLTIDADLTKVITPMVRVVWTAPVGVDHPGAYLQIGVALPGAATRLAVENVSGQQSAWLLVGGGATTPSDDIFALPDGATSWIDGGADAHSVVSSIGRTKPYALYLGSNSIVEGAVTVLASNTTLFPRTLSLDEMSKLTIVVENTDTTIITNLVAVVTHASATKLTAQFMIDTGVGAATDPADIVAFNVSIEPSLDDLTYETTFVANGVLFASGGSPASRTYALNILGVTLR